MGVDVANVYREYGIASLFIAMYIGTIYAFIRDLQRQRKDMREMLGHMIAALEQSKKVCEDYNRICSEMKNTLDLKLKQDAEFMAFLKGRDERRGGRGG